MTTVKALAEKIEGQVIGDENLEITGITNIENPLAGHITFVQDVKGLNKVKNTDIACLIVPESIKEASQTLIQVSQPKAAWAKLLNEFFPPKQYEACVAENAYVSESAKLGTGVSIEPFAVICDNAEIGDGAVIRAGAYISDHVQIGSGSIIHPNVMIYENCKIGNGVIIHAGTVVGSDGFGYVDSAQGRQKVPQVGNVIIEDGVEIGANCTVDCATVGSTIIGAGCKIDNQVQIAHNVVIGPHTALSAQCGISGSSKVGAFVTMGGKAGLGDHVEIGNQVIVGAGSGLPSGKKIPEKIIIFGQPARPYPIARKQIGAQLRAAETLEEVKALRKELDELKKELSDNK